MVLMNIHLFPRYIYKMIKLYNKIKSNYFNRKEKFSRTSMLEYLGIKKGYILVIVLVICAFLVGLTSDFIYKSKNYISLLIRVKDDVNSEFLAYSGFEIAKTILDVDRLGLGRSFMQSLNNNRKIDSYSDIWALNFPPIQVEDGTITIKIEDENSKINISAMANEYVEKSPYYGIMQRFFYNLGFSIDLADVLVDWIDPDDVRFPYGAESPGFYLNQTPPYRAKNNELDSIEEILMVKDMTPGIFYGLSGGNMGSETDLVNHNKGKVNLTDDLINQMSGEAKSGKSDNDIPDTSVKIGPEKSRCLYDYLRAYGNGKDFTDDKNKININTASFRVLSSFSDTMTTDIVEDIIRKRQLAPFTTISEFNSIIGKDADYSNIADVKSHIFKITVVSLYNRGKATLTIYFDRDEKKILYWSLHH